MEQRQDMEALQAALAQEIAERKRLTAELHAMEEKLHFAQQQIQGMLTHTDHSELTDPTPANVLHGSLLKAMARTKRANGLMALIHLDLDHFKVINDALGHAIGDELLITFAACLKSAMRATDMVARLGSDEFAIIVEGLHTEQDIKVVVDKICKNTEKNFATDNDEFKVTCSMGIAFYRSEDISVDLLIKQADKALDKAKQAGRNCYEIAK